MLHQQDCMNLACLRADFLLQPQVSFLRHFHDAAAPRQALVEDRCAAMRRELREWAARRRQQLWLPSGRRRLCSL